MPDNKPAQITRARAIIIIVEAIYMELDDQQAIECIRDLFSIDEVMRVDQDTWIIQGNSYHGYEFNYLLSKNLDAEYDNLGLCEILNDVSSKNYTYTEEEDCILMLTV